MSKNTEEKLDLILEKLERIDRTINPPFWQVALKWIVNHFLTLLILVFVAVIVWKVWGIVLDIIEVTDNLQAQFGLLKDSTTQAVEKLKFWR